MQTQVSMYRPGVTLYPSVQPINQKTIALVVGVAMTLVTVSILIFAASKR